MVIKKSEYIDIKFKIQCNFYNQELLGLYINGKYDELSQKFIEKFIYFENMTYLKIRPHDQFFIDSFVDTFLYLFTQPDYILNPTYGDNFVNMNPVISNVVAMSAYKNTDKQIAVLQNFNNMSDFYKFLSLLSARNQFITDYELLFSKNSQIASLWYFRYFFLDSYPSELMNNNIVEHIARMPSNLELAVGKEYGAYFISTYYDTDNDRKVKLKINDLIKNYLKQLNTRINNKPVRHKIAVITALWMKDHAIHKAFYEYIKSLKADYHITLIHLGPENEKIDKSIFDDYKNILFNDLNQIDFSPVMNNDYMLVFYPDIGMSRESIYLSNLRIAPVQVTGYGHPSSTFGSETDYFLGGTEVEMAEHAGSDYSEKLVLMPTIGNYPFYPGYKKKQINNAKNIFIINCSWTPMKINYNIIKTLGKIIKRADKKLLFRIFPGWIVNRWNEFIPFKNELESLLGKEYVEIITSKDYFDYLSIIEEGDLAVYSYPFSGYCTIIDSIYLEKPAVVWEGNKAYNRLGSALLKRMGMEELIVSNESDYINKITSIINDDEYRKNLTTRIKNIDLKSTIFNSADAEYFKRAINYLIDNNDKLKSENSKSPVIIEAL